ncbi:zinc finger MYM-type protein 1-like [Leptinotarsa decemlineata]|uniref:zinc finger MYM-type protein 1-like n=1 Tax=Leptinotarsa decemlineata TaxID=7539 RepID=UPI003D304852
MVEYLALFDPIMNEHLRKASNKDIHVYYLGKNIQNELISVLAKAVQEKILAYINSAKYYSIILDCTPDVSHVEQMTIIVRIVKLITDERKCEIKEYFLGFVPLSDTTGAGLTEKILDQLNEMSLSLENLRGQGYDNGSNTKGKHSGVQKRILDINPRAFFVPCSSHTLNLVVNDAAKCCLAATSFFNLVEKIYVYFSASTHRWEVLLRHVPSLTLKPLSDTRWESRIDALRPLRYQLADVHDALVDIYENHTLIGASGNQIRIEAQSIAKKIADFKFVASLVVWYNILFEINLTSKVLQSQESNLNTVTNALLKTKTFFESCRSDLGLEKMLVEAKEISEEMNIEASFASETKPVRLRKKKRQLSYEAEDEPICDAKDQFKINFYFAVLDTAVNSVDERFNQLKNISHVFGFLYNVHEMQNKNSKVVLEHCIKLEESLSDGNSKDVDATELCSELQAIARRVPNNTAPQDVLNYICANELLDSVPNLVTAIRVLLTLPVSVASGERSFSKLKLIKTYI